MRTRRHLAMALLPALLLSACATTTTTTRMWNDPGNDWARVGHVESIRETVRRQEGNPGAGAVAGAFLGGIFGSALGGHTHYDRWGNAYRGGSAAGAVIGAIGGAAVGAAASQGGSEERWYEVYVRFDDGALETFVYGADLPFRAGDPVVQTPQGLARM